MVEITCNSGYNVIGTSEIVCQADGSWSGTPTCDPLGKQYKCSHIFRFFSDLGKNLDHISFSLNITGSI